MKKLLFNISFIILINTQLFSVIAENSRLIIFEKVGQRERVKTNEKISLVYGKNIKTEYVYLNYLQGKSSDEYFIELKTIEPFLKDISKLKKYNDSLVIELSQTSDIDTVFVEKEPKKETENANQVELKNNSVDSLINVTDSPQDQNFITKIPKILNRIDAVDFIRKQNESKIYSNNLEIKKIDKQIDSINTIISDPEVIGLKKNRIAEYLREIDLLKLNKNEYKLLNEQLTYSNKLLEKELIARNTQYDSLMRLIYIMVLIILLIIVIASAIYYSYFQKKKYNKQLSEINDQLEIINKELLKSNFDKEKLLSVIKGELNVASKYVSSLLPKAFKDEHFNIDWVFKPSEELGGDSFGYHYIDNDNFAIYLLDVSGHGVGASLHSVQVLNILQNSALPNVDFKKPEDVMNALNNIFQMNNYSGLYFTIFYAIYNLPNKTLTYSAAGHPPMLLWNKGNLINLESQNIFIGAVKHINYTSDTIKINNDDTLFVFSDGAFEIIDTKEKVWTFEDFRAKMSKESKSKSFSIEEVYNYNIKLNNDNTLDDDFSLIKINFISH